MVWARFVNVCGLRVRVRVHNTTVEGNDAAARNTDSGHSHCPAVWPSSEDEAKAVRGRMMSLAPSVCVLLLHQEQASMLAMAVQGSMMSLALSVCVLLIHQEQGILCFPSPFKLHC